MQQCLQRRQNIVLMDAVGLLIHFNNLQFTPFFSMAITAPKFAQIIQKKFRV